MSIVVGVVLKPGVDEALAGVSTIREVLEDAVILSEASGYHANERLPGYVERVDRETFAARVELVVVFGGDGTLIHAASLLVDRVVPILGVNLGRIGFLTEINVDQFARSLRMWRQGDLPHSDRMRLDIEVVREGGVLHRRRVLNDVVVARQALSRIATYRVHYEGALITSIRGDGVIIATPTGSTAYCMAAGGPIITPDLEALAITPICPYQLTQRPLVMKPTGGLTVSFEAGDAMYATLDGQSGIELRAGDLLTVHRAPVPSRIVTAPWRDYFDVLRTKLRWGDQ